MPTPNIIAAADIGSIQRKRFGWAIRKIDCGATKNGTSIVKFVDELVGLLNEKNTIALGFECPLFVPVRDEPVSLTKARNGEGNRPWSAGAGSGALAIGLTETAWILRRLRTNVETTPKLTFKWKEFVSNGGLLLWEAFVSGKAKANTDAEDAELAVEAFCDSLPDPESSDMIHEESVMSLVGASALWAGWDVDADILKESCLVIAAIKSTQSEVLMNP